MSEEKQVFIKRYLGVFAIGYLIMFVVFVAIAYFYVPKQASGTSALYIFTGGGFAAWSFVRGEKRAPTKIEKNLLVFGSLVLATIFEVVLSVVIVFSNNIFANGVVEKTVFDGPLIIAVSTVFGIILLISYFLLNWFYGSQAELMAMKYKE